jgi:hypothetical protein
MKYAIATQRNVYQPDYQGLGAAGWLMDQDGDPLLFGSQPEAAAHIDSLYDTPYCTVNGEAGRPDYWIVDEDAVNTVQACHEDLSQYTWPEDCADWDCAQDGNVCGSCSRCLLYMAGRDEAVLRGSLVE